MRHLKIKSPKLASLHSLYRSQKLRNQVISGELAAIREELANKTYQSYLLYEINKTINTFLEPIDIAAMIVQALVALTGAQSSTIMLLNQESNELEILSHCGIDTIDEELVHFKNDCKNYLPWQVIQSREPFINLEASEENDFQPSLSKYVLSIPMIYDKVALGTINIHTMGPKYKLNEQHIEFINNLSGQAALAFQNSHMYSQLKQQAKFLEKQAITDGLTGLFNHRTFQQKLSEEITRSRRYGMPLSLVLFDIDFFKKFNDTYGHQFGDEVLRTISTLIHNSIRTIDIAARYGGEEFAIILPHTDLEGALTVAERIRTEVDNHVFTNQEGTLHVKVTISLGVAQWNGYDPKNKLVEAADQELYKAKHNGRNQVQPLISAHSEQ